MRQGETLIAVEANSLSYYEEVNAADTSVSDGQMVITASRGVSLFHVPVISKRDDTISRGGHSLLARDKSALPNLKERTDCSRMSHTLEHGHVLRGLESARTHDRRSSKAC